MTNQKRARASRTGRTDALPSLALFSLVHLHSDLIQILQSVHLKQCKFSHLDSTIWPIRRQLGMLPSTKCVSIICLPCLPVENSESHVFAFQFLWKWIFSRFLKNCSSFPPLASKNGLPPSPYCDNKYTLLRQKYTPYCDQKIHPIIEKNNPIFTKNIPYCDKKYT